MAEDLSDEQLLAELEVRGCKASHHTPQSCVAHKAAYTSAGEIHSHIRGAAHAPAASRVFVTVSANL